MGKIEGLFIEEDEIRGQIPDDYLDGVAGRRLYLILYRGLAEDTDSDDEEIRGMALFVSDLEQNDCFELRLIKLSEPNIGHGIGKMMVEYAVSALSKRTPIAITTNIPIEIVDKSLLALLERWGFVETGTQEKVIYALGDLLDSDFYDAAASELRKTNSIVGVKGLVRSQIVEFTKKMESEGIPFDIKDMDENYSVFFVRKDKILGFLDMAEVEANVLCLRRQYIKKCEETKYAMPLLFAKALSIAEQRMEDIPVFICQNKPKLMEYFVGVFGESIDKQTYKCFVRR